MGNRGTYHFLQSDIPSLAGRTDEGEPDLGLEIDKYFTKQSFLSRMRAVKWHSFKKTFVNPGPYLRDLFSPSLFLRSRFPISLFSFHFRHNWGINKAGLRLHCAPIWSAE